MLASAAIIEAVAATLQRLDVRPLVVDPVAASQHGDALLRPDALEALRDADPAAGHAGDAEPGRGAAADRDHGHRRRLGPRGRDRAARTRARPAVLVKGGHLPGGDAVDLLYDGVTFVELSAPRRRDRSHPRLGRHARRRDLRGAGPGAVADRRGARRQGLHHRRGRRLVPARRRAGPGRALLARPSAGLSSGPRSPAAWPRCLRRATGNTIVRPGRARRARRRLGELRVVEPEVGAALRPAARRGCPARRCDRSPSPGSGRRRGSSRAGAR